MLKTTLNDTKLRLFLWNEAEFSRPEPGCECKQRAHAHFSLCPCVQVFSRNTKLLINQEGWGSRVYIFPPLSAATCSISHPVPSRWCRDYEFSRQLIGDAIKSLFFFLIFSHSFFLPSPPPLHSPAQHQIKYIFIHRYPLFRLCAAARKCLAKQQMDCVCVCVYSTCVSEGDQNYVCMLSPPRLPWK